MSEPNKAVFLSYASQDAEAARRICEALRAAGVEVWFDQSELVGGDAWDAKIRKQIKECALFVPVISAATQARTEGYFRLEWRLADQRTHLMARGRPFLLPVVIDDTRDAGAHVPDSFTEVQWTRLPRGETPPTFCAQVQKLLDGENAIVSPVVGASSAGGRLGNVPVRRRFHPAWLFILIPVGVLLIGFGGMAIKRFKDEGAKAPTPTIARAAAGAPVPAASEAAKLADQARRHYQGIFTRADLAQAEELGRRATDLEPALARAWAVRAAAEACYLMRGFVASDRARQRAHNAQTFASRALAIDKNEPEALIALGQLAMFQAAPGQAEAFYRRVLTLEPDNRFARRYLSIVLRSTSRVPEAIAVMQDAARRAPDDALTHFDLALAYAYGWDWPRAWTAADEALKQQPFPGAQMLKVRLAFQWKGDVALMRALLAEVDVLYRSEDDAVLWDMRCGLFERRPDRVLEAAGRTARTYLEETFIFPGPKAWFPARAHELAGRDGLARQQWQAAEAVLRERLRVDPQNLELRLKLAVTLAWLKQTEEARAELAAMERAWREQLNPDRAWDLASFYAATGDAAAAVPLLRMALHAGTGIAPLTLHHLRLDPWWDQIREAPEFRALLANPPPLPAPATATPAAQAGGPDQKSIAVLAFANKSDDPANELFSDGLSEDLIGALGRVPGLTVTGWTSSLFLKKQNLPTAEIGKQLGVAYVVRGSVYRSGNTVRITAQVSRAANDVVVWSSGPLDRELKNSFKVRDEIAGLIAQALSLKLGVVTEAKAGVNPDALSLYLKGRQAWNLRTMAGYAQAETLLNRAIGLEPKFARAHAALADVWLIRGQDAGTLGRFDQRHASELGRILDKVRYALVLDPESPEANASLGNAEWMAWDFAAAERALRRAIELNPSYASARQWLGRVLDTDGRLDEARAEMKLAAGLDPLSVRILDNYASVLHDSGAIEEAFAVVERALEIQPMAQQARKRKAEVLLGLGRRGEAIAIARLLREENAHSTRWLEIFARAGLTSELEGALRELDAAEITPAVYLALGRREDAIGAFQPTATVTALGGFMWSARLDPIRHDARVLKALDEMGLAAAHARAQAWRANHAVTKPGTKP